MPAPAAAVIRDSLAGVVLGRDALYPRQIEDAMEDGSFSQARGALEKLKCLMEGGLTGELVGLESRLASLEALAEVDGTDEPGEHP